MRLAWLWLFVIVCAAPAHARWHEAQTDHFVIYADDSAKDVQAFAEMLENYHSAMELLTGQKVEGLSPSNRVVIFAVGNERELQRLFGGDRYIQGFYIPRAGFSRAFVQDVKVNRKDLDKAMQVLLHEYAHHFLMSNSRFAMPRWLSEGAAEFYSSAQFPRSGNVSIGRPAIHRAYELNYADDVSIEELLDEDVYSAKKRTRYDAFYGRAWLLYHYLTFSNERKGQLSAYWLALAQGGKPLVAAEQAFGDLGSLEKDIDRYAQARRMLSFNLTPEMLPPAGKITVREVSEGHAAVLPLIIRSQRGVDAEEATAIVQEVRKIATLFPKDGRVFAALAEAEFDAGDDLRAIAAADRAISLDPAEPNAYIQKGYALFRMAEEAEEKDAAYARAMQPFTALNKIENDHPLPLIYFYRSFTARGAVPVETARHALERAAQLAPFDQSLWFETGLMQAQEGKLDFAIASLSPIANHPHGGSMAASAGALIAAMENAPEGQPFDPEPILASMQAMADDQPGL